MITSKIAKGFCEKQEGTADKGVKGKIRHP
jgi:hypothetical protein